MQTFTGSRMRGRALVRPWPGSRRLVITIRSSGRKLAQVDMTARQMRAAADALEPEFGSLWEVREAMLAALDSVSFYNKTGLVMPPYNPSRED